MISASFAAFAQATGSAQFYLWSVKSPPQHQRSVVFFRKSRIVAYLGSLLLYPSIQREKRGYLRATQSGDCPLAAKIGPEKSFCPVAFGDRQCENSGAVLLLPTRFRIHLLNYPVNTAKFKIPNSAHIWLSSVHEKIVGLFPMPISHAISTAFWHIAWWLPSSNSVRTSPGSLAAWSLDRYRGCCRRMALSTGPGGFRPGAGLWGRKGSQGAVVSPWNPLVLAIQSSTLGRCKGWKAHVESKMIAHLRECARSCEMAMNDDQWRNSQV